MNVKQHSTGYVSYSWHLTGLVTKDPTCTVVVSFLEFREDIDVAKVEVCLYTRDLQLVDGPWLRRLHYLEPT